MKRAEDDTARLAAIVESSADAIIGKGLDWTITAWNPAAERLFGYSASEALGCQVTMLIPPQRHDEEREIQERVTRGERVDNYETLRVTKDGSRIDVAISISPMRDPTGTIIGAASVTRDISQRKRDEQHQQSLVNELDHRVKNTLALVAALCAQTAKEAQTVEEFQSAFDGRIQALAAAHRELSQARWRGAALDTVIRRSVAPYRAQGRETLSIEGPAVILTPRATLSLALILHELSTNATKYGALADSAHGHVRIEWQVTDSNGVPHLLLSWIERDGGPVTPPTRQGFGLTFIGRSVEYELTGTLDLQFDREGLTCRIDVPLTHETGQSHPTSGAFST